MRKIIRDQADEPSVRRCRQLAFVEVRFTTSGVVVSEDEDWRQVLDAALQDELSSFVEDLPEDKVIWGPWEVDTPR